MSPSFIGVLNHLWQSSLFAAAAGVLTLLLKRNSARTRYWLWFAASVKFLVPFSLLVDAGSRVEWRNATEIAQPSLSLPLEQVFTAPALALAAPALSHGSNYMPGLLLAAWLCGLSVILFSWWRQWRRIQLAVRTAKPSGMQLPIRTMTSATLLEPGIFGVFRPVLLVPEGITERLMPDQLEAIVAHELCHLRCHDNLMAAVHMLTEAIFWFHPLLWWIGKRMVEEREHACDEEVLRLGNEPQVYAEGILKVCRFYLESPLDCVSGITGSDLRKRIRGIMTYRVSQRLDAPRKLLLAVAGLSAVATPIALGVLSAPQIRAQSAVPLAFDVASIKMVSEKTSVMLAFSPRVIVYTFTLKRLIATAYSLNIRSISTADPQVQDILDRGMYRVEATTEQDVSREQQNLMLQTLLADRFKLTLHRVPKVEPVYKLVVASNGPKLSDSAGEGASSCVWVANRTTQCAHETMSSFSVYLSARMGRVVLDQTSLQGAYDFALQLEGIPSLDDLRTAMSSGDPAAAKRIMGAAMNDWTTSSIFSDIQKQLGLELEADKAPVDSLVIDRLSKPSEN